jgi:hypothetical protein
MIPKKKKVSGVDSPGYQDEIMPYLMDVLERAPSYGYCGLIITFHRGQVATIVDEKTRITIKTEF